ncbi:MAG: C39 family peptidase [Clostridiales bacterium]|nr:C39 family peptidase [Clostridiales bacterium]
MEQNVCLHLENIASMLCLYDSIKKVDNITERTEKHGVKYKNKIFLSLTITLISAVLIMVICVELSIIKNLGYFENENINNINNGGTAANDIASDKKDNERSLKVIKEIKDVPVISQMPELPSGCEATALTMLLNWSGVHVGKVGVARNIPKAYLPVLKNGKMYGKSPNEAFIGDPFSNGFGVYHKAIADIIDKYLPGKGLDVTGISFQNLLGIIDSGRPVIVWTTKDLTEPFLSTIWTDGNNNTVYWIAPEHTYLLTGYSDGDVIVNDPYSGQRRAYPISKFKDKWEIYGRQAVTVSGSIKGKVVETDLSSFLNAKSKK